MPRRRWRSRVHRAGLSPEITHWFETGQHIVPEDGLPIESFRLRFCDDDARQIWRAARAEILVDWIAEHPGTRPWAWWRFDATEPRRRLGGVGTPAHEVLAYLDHFPFGLPAHWVQPWMVEYYNGRARNIHGERIGTEYREGHFAGVAIDPVAPPRFESQAAYLDRHALLDSADRLKLPEDAFEPESINLFSLGGAT
jgi:hypothetical protein